jgi:hypothetical protein
VLSLSFKFIPRYKYGTTLFYEELACPLPSSKLFLIYGYRGGFFYEKKKGKEKRNEYKVAFQQIQALDSSNIIFFFPTHFYAAYPG